MNCSIASNTSVIAPSPQQPSLPPAEGTATAAPISSTAASVGPEVRRGPEHRPFGVLDLDEQHILVHVPRLDGIVLGMHRDLADDTLERPDLRKEIPDLAPVLEERLLGVLDPRLLDQAFDQVDVLVGRHAVDVAVGLVLRP